MLWGKVWVSLIIVYLKAISSYKTWIIIYRTVNGEELTMDKLFWQQLTIEKFMQIIIMFALTIDILILLGKICIKKCYQDKIS